MLIAGSVIIGRREKDNEEGAARVDGSNLGKAGVDKSSGVDTKVVGSSSDLEGRGSNTTSRKSRPIG